MSKIALLRKEIEKSFQGHPAVVEKALICFLSRGHLLIEDEPGVGKTLLAQSLAKALGLLFRRIQMTPDLLPSDVTGGLLWIPQPGEFRFRPGPVFSDVILLDELNRASAKTQSAVLQAMEEKKVTVDGTDHELSPLFFVIATQNPFESAGAHHLPDSQLDRFALKIRVGRLDKEAEKKILLGGDRDRLLDSIQALMSREELIKAQEQTAAVTVSEAVLDHVMKLAIKLRDERRASLSTRALQSLLRLSQGRAFLNGRDFVLPEDVRDLVLEAWAHRVRAQSHREAQVYVEEVLRETPVL